MSISCTASRSAILTSFFPLGTLFGQSRWILHGQRDIAMLAKHLAACTRLSTTVSQLFEPQLQKIDILRTPAFIFCLPWGRPCGNHAKCCMNEKTIQCLPKPSQHVPIYLPQFPSYSNRKCKKIAVITYRSPHFCFPWRSPCDYHAICCGMESQFNACETPCSMYLSIFSSFRVIRCSSQCVSPKIAVFTTFLFPLGQSR